jgi:hypothetical protein
MSRQELLAWVNSTLEMSHAKIEDLASGTGWHVMDVMGWPLGADTWRRCDRCCILPIHGHAFPR